MDIKMIEKLYTLKENEKYSIIHVGNNSYNLLMNLSVENNTLMLKYNNTTVVLSKGRSLIIKDPSKPEYKTANVFYESNKGTFPINKLNIKKGLEVKIKYLGNNQVLLQPQGEGILEILTEESRREYEIYLLNNMFYKS